MRIQSIEAIPVSYPEPNDFNALRHLCLCKITADDGRVGWGESITQFPEASFATQAVIEAMAEGLIGRDPVHVEAIWRRNKDVAWWYGYGGGIASYAVAAIDIALWDLKGQALGASVLDLLGGTVHEQLPAIASCHAHYDSIPEMVVEAQEWLSTGLQGVKTGFGKRGNARLGYEHDRDVDYVRAMREGIGADKMLMIDCGIAVKWDVTDAVRRCRDMEPYNLTWVEEPLGAWDPEGYANLRGKMTTRIAYGEKEWTLAGFERVLATNRRRRRRRSWACRGDHGLQEGLRSCRGVRPTGERACVVVGDRDRGEPRDLVQLARLQALRVQAAPQPDAARARDGAVRPRRRVGLPAQRARARHRGDRGGRRRVPKREGARRVSRVDPCSNRFRKRLTPPRDRGILARFAVLGTGSKGTSKPTPPEFPAGPTRRRG